MAPSAPANDSPRVTFRDVFAIREFPSLFGSFLLSTVGDELARVALTVLVYQRTSSPLLSAVTFAISYLPWLVGGPLLAAAADRFPRHRVLIAADAVRAVLVGAMALPGTPLPLLLALLLAVAVCGPPFESARSALMADVVQGDRYPVATSLTNVTLQASQVVGFLLGGALVASVNASVALLVDALTFVVSAVWLLLRLQRRPAPALPEQRRPSLLGDSAQGIGYVRRSPRLRAILGLLWIGTLFTGAPEAIAAPLADQLGWGNAGIGVLLAAHPLGLTLGGLVVARLVPARRRQQLTAPLVVLSLAPLVAVGVVALLGPGSGTFGVVVGLLFLSGLGTTWNIPLNVAFVQAVPPAFRGRAFGVAASGLYGVQGLGALGAGLLADRLPAAAVVSAAGVLGLLAVGAPLVGHRRAEADVASAPDGAGPSEA